MSSELYRNSIQISSIGINHTETAGFAVDRPTGIQEYLFELLQSPVMVEDATSCRNYTRAVFIIYSPGHGQHWRAEEPLQHSWLLLTGDGVADCLARYQIPVDRALEIDDPKFLIAYFEEASRHKVRQRCNWQDAVMETVRSLFRQLARTLVECQNRKPARISFEPGSPGSSPYEMRMVTTLHQVRARVFKDLRRRWSLGEMADLANMSASRFAAAYRAYFGTRPIGDLLDVRLSHAEVLLRHLPISVSDAARLSGFGSTSNFYIQFRARTDRALKDIPRQSGQYVRSAPHAEMLSDVSEAARKVELLYISPTGHWTFDKIRSNLDDDHPNCRQLTITDDLRKHPPMVFVNNVTLIPGHATGSALQFDGASYAMIPEAIVDTALSYTVSGWMRCDHPGRMTGVSLGNSHHSAFYLQYISGRGGFTFATTISERYVFAIVAASPSDAPIGVWHHVTGVHDAEKQQIRLYVNGVQMASSSFNTPWTVESGDLYLGCTQVFDTIVDQWAGALDDIRLYDRALSDEEIITLSTDF